MNAHVLIRTKSFGSVEGYCSCGYWSMESIGRDESSRLTLATGFKFHAAREADK